MTYYSDSARFAVPFLEATSGGSLAEIGVYDGNTFHRLYALAKDYSRDIHAFDSFEGLAQPHATLDHGRVHYAGKFATNGGEGAFRSRFPDAQVHRLWITNESVSHLPEIPLSFAYVDVDHYAPTQAILPYVWRNVIEGGAMLCDDFVPDLGYGSSLAIAEFIEANGLPYTQPEGRWQALFVKPQEHRASL